MPIYEYACRNCDHALDALQKMSDEPLVDCPECGEPQLRRLLSAPRFRLKGQGWYETDFKKDNQRNLAKRDSEPAKADSAPANADSEPAKADKQSDGGKQPDQGKKSDKKSDSKPSAKSDS